MHKLILVIPDEFARCFSDDCAVRGFAADDEGHDRHDERQDLRQDRQQLEQLRPPAQRTDSRGKRANMILKYMNSERTCKKTRETLRSEAREDHESEHHDNEWLILI
jgi:hypothetical protein